MTTIPVTDLRPGDLVDTGNATAPGPIVRVAQVATYDGRTYVVQRDPGALVPASYTFTTDQRADVYSRA